MLLLWLLLLLLLIVCLFIKHLNETETVARFSLLALHTHTTNLSIKETFNGVIERMPKRIKQCQDNNNNNNDNDNK